MRKVVVGLTGNIGSGKSTVLKFFRSLGCETADADQVVHQALRKGGKAYGAVRRLFGPSVVGPGGELDRGRIAAVVFHDAARRRRLEKILHPLVVRDFRRRIARKKGGCLVLDIPLLFEARLRRWVDKVAVVWAPRSARMRRVLAQRGLSPADFRRRENAQMSLSEKRRRADIVIDNSGSLRNTRLQTRKAFQTLVS